MRDKSHMDAVERWAEFVRTHDRNEWKPGIDAFINSVYEKADDFYVRLQETEKGREVLERLREDRMKVKTLK
ncbi:MAG: hypothetical protein Q8P57_01840 [Candidatus Pacearchaeota archaeon]|nr:hypothetical protein [Candidatus Pacearchaeota archaeon]